MNERDIHTDRKTHTHRGGSKKGVGVTDIKKKTIKKRGRQHNEKEREKG